MRFVFWKLLAVAVLLAPAAAAVQAGDERAAAIEALLQRAAEHGVFSGSVLVAHQGKVIYRAGHGLANREWNQPNRPDTVFRLGSLSKSFTAVAVMQLVQSGKLRLDDAIHAHLPQFPAEYGKQVTIRQLLTHQSGIPNYVRLPGWFEGRYKQPISDAAFLKAITDLPLEFEPGKGRRYSNAGYFILGKIIEAASGMPYTDFVAQHITAPAGMSDTRHDSHTAIIANRAAGYQWTAAGGYRNEHYLNTEVFVAAASLVSSVDDLLKWDQALYSDTLLNQSSRDILFAAEAPLSWEVQTRSLADGAKTVKTVAYNGAIMGFSSMFTRFPEDRYLVVLLSNNGTGYDSLNALTLQIAAILYGVPQTKPLPAAYRLTQAFLAAELDKGLAQVRQNPTLFEIDESRLNSLGYRFLEFRLLDQAIAVFDLITTLFPNSANAFDSLGEAYLIAGKREQAVIHYQKSLALDPENHNAKAVLERLKQKP